MAKGLDSMIRLNEWQVDQKRRVLGEKIEEVNALEEALNSLEQELQNEQSAALAAPQEAGLFYGNYANEVISRREELQTAIAEKERQVEHAQENLHESYRELKKYELIHKRRKEREAKELDKKDQDVLDELGLQAHQRRMD